MRIASIVPETIVDGPGLRTAIFFQGCAHNCPGCHNPELHSFKTGQKVSVKNLLKEIEPYINPLICGITLTGGDPMYQWDKVWRFLLRFKARYPKLDVWLYTGFKWDNIKNRVTANLVDVVVDEPFIKELYRPGLLYRGSLNQHLVDVIASKDTRYLVERKVGKAVC